jgi:hypothetical protein
MTRLLRNCLPVLCASLLCAVPLTAQTAAPAGAPPTGAPGGGQRAPYVPKNLKVLPDNTDLRKVMGGYEGDLGVECSYCHTTTPDPVTHRPDRASDANPMKDKARYMITMTQDINAKYLAQVPNRKFADQPVTCGTCHRGQSHPAVYVAPPRPQGPRPGGPPPAGTTAPPTATPPAS